MSTDAPSRPAVDDPASLAAYNRAVSDPTSEVAVGTRWMAVATIVTQLSRIGFQIILARLLVPGDFGVLTLGLTFLLLLDLFKEAGTVPALIQRKEITERMASSVLYLNLAIGAVCTLAFVAAAPWLAGSLDEPDATLMLQVLGGTLVISSAGLVQLALLRRALQFRRMSVITMSQAISTGVVAVVLALAGLGAWSLIIGQVAGAVVNLFQAWRSTTFRPRLLFSLTDIKALWSMSINTLLMNIFFYLFNNADKVMVGRQLGGAQLGIYGLGQRVLMYPVRSITSTVNSILFPTFSRMQDDHRAVGRGFLRSSAAVAALAFPLMGLICVLARPFVVGIFGPEWEEAVPLIAIFAPIGLLHSLHYSIGPLYMSQGKARAFLWWSVVTGIGTVVAYLIGIQRGLNGLAVAYAIWVLVITYPAFAIPLRYVDLRFHHLARAVWPYLWSTAAGAAVAFAARIGLEAADVAEALVFFVAGGAGGLVYLGLMALLRPPALRDLKLVITRRARR